MRDACNAARPLLVELLAAEGFEPSMLWRSLYLVSSPFAFEKLRTLAPFSGMDSSLACVDPKLTRIDSGIYVAQLSASMPALRTELEHVGATVSLFQVSKRLHSSVSVPTKCAVDLSLIYQRASFRTLRSVAWNRHIGASSVCAVVVQLLSGLQSLAHHERFQTDFVHNVLQYLGALIDALALYRNDALRASRLYEVICEELFLLLSYVRPYTVLDYCGAVTHLQRTRGTFVPNCTPLHMLCTSGMDAITTACVAAIRLHEGAGMVVGFTRLSPFLDYGEVHEVIGLQTSDDGCVVIATPNASTTAVLLDLDALWSKVQELCSRLLFVTLILDLTIETSENQLRALFEQVAPLVNARKLNIMLCKSYQKYATFGCGKIMAGNLTVINNGAPHFLACRQTVERANELQSWMDMDECQLLVFMLLQCHIQELMLVRRAALNATVLREFCGLSGKRAESSCSLPFVHVDKSCAADFQDETSVNRRHPFRRLKICQLVEQLDIEDRDTFGSLNTSQLSLPTTLRMNTGFESPARIVEKCYAVGKFVVSSSSAVSVITMETILRHAAMLSNSDELDFTAVATMRRRSFVPCALASCFDFARLFLTLAPTAETLLRVTIQRFLQQCVGRISPEMRSRLASWVLISSLKHRPDQYPASASLLSLLSTSSQAELVLGCLSDSAIIQASFVPRFLHGMTFSNCLLLIRRLYGQQRTALATCCVRYLQSMRSWLETGDWTSGDRFRIPSIEPSADRFTDVIV
eukprot:TRINITY_DN2954_c0_g1_i1.p1 TRINITY_DN2954_c0_g1~~TRINITY_DN2954_c0_g1_i1.p1  ORF type:complete len:752 (+),score=121.87 TRINITY_DN2954_c0_g1_i1:446-2701(+)